MFRYKILGEFILKNILLINCFHIILQLLGSKSKSFIVLKRIENNSEMNIVSQIKITIGFKMYSYIYSLIE